MRHGNGIQGLRQGADLIDLDEDGVGNALLNTLGQTDRIGYEQVVTHQLHLLAQSLGEHIPAQPIRLCHAVFQGDDGILFCQSLPLANHLLTGENLSGLGQPIGLTLLVIPLRGCRIHGDHKILSGTVARYLNGFHNAAEGIFVLFQHGSIATLVTYAGNGNLSILQDFLQAVEHLCAPAHSFFHAGGRYGDDHKFLNVHIIAGMGTAVKNVHHRYRHHFGVGSADIAIQADTLGLCSGLGAGQGNAQDGIGTQAALVCRAVQPDQYFIDPGLIGYIHTSQCRGDLPGNSLHSLGNTLTQIPAGISIPELVGFKDARGSAGRDRGSAYHPIFQDHFHLHGRISPGIQNFSSDHILNQYFLFHSCLPLYSIIIYSTINRVPIFFPGYSVSRGSSPAKNHHRHSSEGVTSWAFTLPMPTFASTAIIAAYPKIASAGIIHIFAYLLSLMFCL